MLGNVLLKSDFSSFELDGWPTISIIMMVVTFVLAFVKAKSSGSIMPNGLAFFILNLLQFFFAICLIFISNQMRIIAFHLFILSIAGMSKPSMPFFVIFGAFTFLCMIGSMSAMGHGAIVSEVSQTSCVNYFGVASVNRCKDDGFLSFCRVISAFSIYVLGCMIVMAFPQMSAGAGGAGGAGGDAGAKKQESPKTTPAEEAA